MLAAVEGTLALGQAGLEAVGGGLVIGPGADLEEVLAVGAFEEPRQGQVRPGRLGVDDADEDIDGAV